MLLRGCLSALFRATMARSFQMTAGDHNGFQTPAESGPKSVCPDTRAGSEIWPNLARRPCTPALGPADLHGSPLARFTGRAAPPGGEHRLGVKRGQIRHRAGPALARPAAAQAVHQLEESVALGAAGPGGRNDGSVDWDEHGLDRYPLGGHVAKDEKKFIVGELVGNITCITRSQTVPI